MIKLIPLFFFLMLLLNSPRVLSQSGIGNSNELSKSSPSEGSESTAPSGLRQNEEGVEAGVKETDRQGAPEDNVGSSQDMMTREDPFEPPKIVLKAMLMKEGPKIDVKKDLTELEKYDLSEMVLVGILWNVKVSKALVKLPNGSVFVVYKNTKLGSKNGYVSDISEGAIEVTETTVDDYEGKKYREIRFIEFKKTKKLNLLTEKSNSSQENMNSSSKKNSSRGEQQLNYNGGE